MAEYINFEAEAEQIEHDEVSDFSDNASENSFIDDQDQDVNTDFNFYRDFTNVENDIDQVLNKCYEESLKDLDNFDELSNLCYGSKEESEIDNFKNFETNIKKFEETLFPRVDIEDQKIHNQIFYAILYALRFDKDGSKNKCDKTEFQKSVNCDLIENLLKKSEFIIDLQKFENMYYEINCILSKYGVFLRIFELKNKYHRLAVKDKIEQKLVRQLSSCLIEKYSGFTQISLKYQKKQRKLFKPIDIIYKPTKRIEIEPLCFFSSDLSKAYSSLYSSGKEKKECKEHINVISVITVINFLFDQRGKKDIVKTVRENQESFIISITKI